VGLLAKLLLGDGTLKAPLRESLEDEGLVVIEEGLPGSVRYNRFRAPGRYQHGKITPERMGLGVSEERLVVYCRSGRAKLLDTPFSNPRLHAIGVSLEHDDGVAIRVDYDQLGVPRVSGEITIVLRTPNAARIVSELSARIERGANFQRPRPL
jgi:hypothetical protein